MNNALHQSGQMFCVGLNHHHAPIDVRERIAFSGSQIKDALTSLIHYEGIQEAAILSTCNRVELYAHGEAQTSNSIAHFLSHFHHLPIHNLEPYLYRYEGTQAISQLFRVTSSLDSLVLGETQVLGQVKEAYHQAHALGTVGPNLHLAFMRAFAVAKRVRRETEVGANAVSISYAAVELARKIFGKLDGLNCLLIGAGEMAELAISHFKNRGANVMITNRTYKRAEILAGNHAAVAYPFDDLPELLARADVVLASTTTDRYLIDEELAKRALKARRFRSIFLIDIGVPRNIAPGLASLDGVYLYNIDDLAAVVEQNQEKRQKEAFRAQEIVDEEIIFFERRLHELEIAPRITQLSRDNQHIAETELTRALELFGDCSAKQKRILETLARNIAGKTLHASIKQIKELKNIPIS